MVLERSLKRYKMLMRIMATHLVTNQKIQTTLAKAKHLRSYTQKLVKYAKKAEKGQTSAKNLLKGRINTQKAQQKLLLEIIPRLKKKTVVRRRRGDNAAMVNISIKGNAIDQELKNRFNQDRQRNPRSDPVKFAKKILVEEKQYLEQLMQNNPKQQLQRYYSEKIKRVQYQQWTYNKSKKQPPRYTLLL